MELIKVCGETLWHKCLVGVPEMGTECLKGSTEDRWVGGEDRSRAEEDL